ncbi:NUDIX hydrolase [Aeromonas bestiarum]|uniref:NUDIX hydrolase n=1 Tax=Aeromonas bestiarum TaxID=105751 RepID=UPI0005017CC8|nr:NUDIX domain-containing protein [Aeromonas bestiarum]KFN18716.1 DNA mismatch repair protein MutT [Aeromonas bestiarum]
MIPIRCKAVSGVALSTIDGETKLLVMKRVKGGFWCHVAGTVEAGETGWQTIIREFGEETGITVCELYTAHYLEQFYESASNTVEVVPVFVVYCPPNQPVRLNDEHTEYRWCTLAEAKGVVSFPGQQALYDHVWHYFIERTPSALMRVATGA